MTVRQSLFYILQYWTNDCAKRKLGIPVKIGVESESTAKDTILTDVEAAADVYSFASDQLIDLVNAGALMNLEDVGEALTVGGRTLDDVKMKMWRLLLKQRLLTEVFMHFREQGITDIFFTMIPLYFRMRM